jgi:Fe-Mn family superoxide dismutase
MYKAIQLPYSFSDLEPFIDAETMEVHYNNHYLGYLEKLNKAISKENVFVPIKNLIQNRGSNEIRNNGGGYYNHSLFFNMLKPPFKRSYGIPSAVIGIMKRDFGGYENFKREILSKAQNVFGSGWVWWVEYPNGKTQIVTTANQDNPLMFNKNLTILLGIDLWEHAYYLKHKSFRDNYVKEIFNIIDWDFVKSQFYLG